jgi:hypothetical protein
VRVVGLRGSERLRANSQKTGRDHVAPSSERRRVLRYGVGSAVAILTLTTILLIQVLTTRPHPTVVSAKVAKATTLAPALASPRARLLPPLPHGPEGPAHSAAPVVAAAPPVWLSIPSIGVDTGLETLALLPDRTLAAPSQWSMAGWYAAGVRPGDRGPAVIAGHVDSVSGPAVFYHLRQLRPGAEVLVREKTGTTLRFLVDTTASYPKERFPTRAVYGPTPLPELRLITCTGDFDFQAHSYRDNLVVSAHLT